MASTAETTGDAMDVNISFILYNGKGLTAEDVLNGASCELCGEDFPYSMFIEAALAFSWEDGEFERASKHSEKPPTHDETRFTPLLLPTPDGYHGKTNHHVDKDLYDGDFPRSVPGKSNSPNAHLESRTSSNLNLELMKESTKLTAGVDIDCPEIVPWGTVSGQVNICQRFTATLRVSGAKNVRPSVVQAYVASMYDEAMKDGAWSEVYSDIDGEHVFRVPGHTNCELVFDSDKPDCYSSLYPQFNASVSRKDTAEKNETTSAENMGFLGGVFLLFSLFGIIVYKRRSVLFDFTRSEVQDEENQDTIIHMDEGTKHFLSYELTAVRPPGGIANVDEIERMGGAARTA